MTDVEEAWRDPVVRAQGAALALVGVLLERGGSLEKGEFSKLLGIPSEVTAQSDKASGEILLSWAAASSEVGP